MGVWITTTVLIVTGILGSQSAKPYRICSLPGTEKDCPQIERNGDLQCVQNFHGIDCLLNIENEKTDFGRVTAEEALVGAKFIQNVVVLGEFKSQDEVGDNGMFATAVLVRQNHTNGLKGLRGKKYCHPGFRFEETVTELVLKEFENAVLKENNAESCSNKVDSNTVLEMELKALTDFFGPSCRPGPWVDLNEENKNYYARYKQLCQLCDPSGDCNLSDGAVPFMQSIDCLVNKGGDVALTTLNSIYEFFNRTENIPKQEDYKYLCRNGSLSTLDKPCFWSKQPGDLIIAHKNHVEEIKTDLQNWLSKHIVSSSSFSGHSPFEGSLEKVLFPQESKLNKIKLFSQMPTVKEFMEGYRVIPNSRDAEKCNKNVRWCTTSDQETQKCLWLAQASLNNAIQPVINCVQSPTSLSCLEDIRNDKADVVTSDAHHGYIAREKKLAPLAYPQTNYKQLIHTAVVIKANEKNINRFENLKSKKACIPEFAGIEWVSFINTARERKVLSTTTCDYGELISDFVGDSCMPGAHDAEHEKTKKTNSEKLCSLCIPNPNAKTAKTCNTDDTNAYYGNLGALKCLKEEGEFAVITLSSDGYSNINDSEFRMLCRNGSLASTTGLKIDSNCSLTTIVDSEVVAKRNGSKNNDISLILLNLERRFGTDKTKAFEVFNVFNGTLNLLFSDTTAGLAAVTSNDKNIKNYVSLFEHVDKCVVKGDGGSASTIQSTIFPLFISILLMLYCKTL